MRAWVAACLMLLCGCVEGEPPAAPEAEPEPRLVEVTGQESASFTADWIAWASVCGPMSEDGAFAGSSGAADLSPPDNLTSLRLEVSWTPVNPSAEALRILILDGTTLIAVLEGGSPLSFGMEAEAAAEREGRLSVEAYPAACPVAPANAAHMLGQEVDVEATYVSLAPEPVRVAT